MASALPDFLQERVRIWDELKTKHTAASSGEPKKIKVKVVSAQKPQGVELEATAGETTPLQLAEQIDKKWAMNNVVACMVNQQKVVDAWLPLNEDCEIRLLTFEDSEGRHVFWHSSAHVLGQAAELELGAKLTIGPALEEGFYYDLSSDKSISEADYKQLETRVNQIIKERQRFERMVVSKDEALSMFKDNKYKQEIIGKLPAEDTITLYRCGPLIDLCRGPHLPSTGRIKAFKITKNSAAYWLGKAENDSLQRVYAISFPDDKQLKEWVTLMEEAKKRDHRVIGRDQELFFFHERSPGSCFFLPHGARLYNTLVEFIRKQYWQRGYTEVVTPNMFNTKLWIDSGHWQNYKEHMFSFQVEGQDFALKPMNCPGHCVMFGHRARSYRELPIRYADFGVLHRNEYSGALTGLTRVRRFCQDDAHIFCMPSQVQAEIMGVLDFLKGVYGIFGFTFELELSTRPEKFLGAIEQWDVAEKQLAAALDEFGQPWKINAGDGAFYGPKIDIGVFDALKRRHQCATIQLDFQLPIRFGLQYEAGGGKYEVPVIVHRAILGSVERMVAILCENFGGKWPFWLSPRQVRVMTISENAVPYAREVVKAIHDAGLFVDEDFTDGTVDKKVRDAQLQQVNYMLVIGDKEVQSRSVNVRTRDNVRHGTKTVESMISEFKYLAANYVEKMPAAASASAPAPAAAAAALVSEPAAA